MAHWVARRLRPREGWGPVALLVGAGLCLASAVVVAGWVPGDLALIPLTLLALLAGRWTARRRWSRRAQALAGVDAGILAALWAAAGGPQRISDLLIRWRAWMWAAFGGGTAQDPAIFLLYASLLAWGAAFFAGWWCGGRRSGLGGFLPMMALTGLSVFYSEKGTLFLFGGLFSALLLTALADLRSWQRRWQRDGVDYASDLEADTILAAGGIAVVLVLLGAFVPVFSVRGFAEWIQATFARPAERVETEAERLLGGVRPPERQSDEADAGGGRLPRAHLLGAAPELGQAEVFRVWAEDVVGPYWRGATYDLYTGRGWEMTVTAEEAVSGTLPVPGVPRYGTLLQHFSRPRGNGGPLFALAEPVAVGADAVALWRGPLDLAAVRVASADYTVTSRIARPLPQDLLAVSVGYPPDIVATYLQLPESLPDRVRALARGVTAGTTAPYDRATRLERYLRRLPYSLDVETPPPGRDVADYFLFDLGEGYCDYYATAYVVMARSLGIPARLAVGYLGGRPDPADGARVVVEENAHSWPEVYFPGWGWVAFEPTAGRPEAANEESLFEPSAGRGASGLGRSGRSLLWAAAVLVSASALAGGIWGLHRARRGRWKPADLSTAWRMLNAEGARLGIPRQRGQTVLEYARALADELEERAAGARWRRERWESRALEARQSLLAFAVAYSHYLYGDGPAYVQARWTGLRGQMTRLRTVRHVAFPGRRGSRPA